MIRYKIVNAQEWANATAGNIEFPYNKALIMLKAIKRGYIKFESEGAVEGIKHGFIFSKQGLEKVEEEE